MMPDSSGAAKENWGEKPVSEENERTPEVGPKSTNPRQEDKKARPSHMLCRWFSLPNFYRREEAENGNFWHTCFNTQNIHIVTALKWFHVLDMPTQNGQEPVGEITFLGLSCLTSMVSRRNS